jgi:predicted acetylornithine/succinylornithine family transaminase
MPAVSTETSQLLDRANHVLIGNYARLPIVMVRGEGSRLWDSDGKEYLDLFAGFGGCVLGHCHPALVAAATEQAKRLWHVGNTYHTVPQIEFAERLNRFAFPGQAFFCHSGAEANEAACKLARLAGNQHSPNRWKIVSLNKSFHGRTMAMIAATGNPAVKAGFEPATPGFTQVEPGDFDALEKAVDDQTAAVLMEPIQGEGGINVYPPDYAARVRHLCDQRGIALIFDEVWTGCGRTGHWFGHQLFRTAEGKPVIPDIMTLGKAVGGGLPVGVMFAKPEIAKLLVPGKHGCTLGGNPICMSVARTIFDVIEREQLLVHAANLGEYAMARLAGERSIQAKLHSVRGSGLFLGVELKEAPTKFVEKALALGIVTNVTAQKVIRLAPPINIAREGWERGLEILIQAIAVD